LQRNLKDASKVFSYTNKGNTVAGISDGSRTLGLGGIGIDAFPIPLNVKDSDKIIEVVKTIEPVFGGINLEDIATPKCFHIYERLYEELDIPVWHDGQHGTALVILTSVYELIGLINRIILFLIFVNLVIYLKGKLTLKTLK
jgi:malate dehydrogenase (oxaloacetate-decarboxylating)